MLKSIIISENYFENRLETEINQLKESIRNMISEQQSHVRQIVQQVACTRSQSSQVCRIVMLNLCFLIVIYFTRMETVLYGI